MMPSTISVERILMTTKGINRERRLSLRGARAFLLSVLAEEEMPSAAFRQEKLHFTASDKSSQ
jgi:hypothetical protein